MAVLKPTIDSIINGLITLSVIYPTNVTAIFNTIVIYRASAVDGPYSSLTSLTLTSETTYTYLDVDSSPSYYYKAQYYHSGTLVTSQFSEPAQETGIYSEYSQPVSTATYPPEIALSANDREIVESIRITLGDVGSIERDYFSSSDPQSAFTCAQNISADKCTWELSEPRGWPQRIILNGGAKTSLADPQVIGYRFLVFSGTACITGSLDVFYNHFRFSDREILLAYDRAINLLVACGLTTSQITTEMRIMQAAILLLEGELRDLNSGGVLRIRDGDTEYDNTDAVRSRTGDLEDLRQKMRDLINCAKMYTSYRLEGVRVD